RKATFYVDESLHKALRLKAANDDISPSDLLNQLLEVDLVEYLEDLEDIAEVKNRMKERGKGVPLEQLMKKISKNG
ncbi:CopG family transcriptional regulator, partial [bacterium]|nr:CopG family transcriptional regulator [bacterium]